MTEFQGYFEGVLNDGWATGWVHWTDVGRGKARLTILVDDVPVAVMMADQYRDDLQSAGFADPACAFLFRIPQLYFDGADHAIDVRLGDVSIPNAPGRFLLDGARGGADEVLETDNLVPTAAFNRWPNGLLVRPQQRFEEIMSGWYFDARPEVRGIATFAADRSDDLALKPGEYALRVAADGLPADAYFRLIVPLTLDPAIRSRYGFSVGVRRPLSAVRGDLFISDLSISILDGENVSRIQSLRKNLKPKGIVRLRGIGFTLDSAVQTAVENGLQPALVVEFRGNGQLQLFAPELLVSRRTHLAATTAPGTFECENIVGQLAGLQLSPLWSPEPDATEASQLGGIPRTANTALPFTQIVVPIFNAGPDVDELIRSLLQHTASPFELILADDGSEEFTRQRLDRWAQVDPRIRVLGDRTNRGYTRNINQALQATVADYVVLLNSDTIVTRDWLGGLYDALFESADVAGAGPVSNAASWQSVPLAKTAGGWAVNPLPADTSVDEMAALVAAASDSALPEVPLLNGFCTLFRRDALEAVGWFDDSVFPDGYGEENDLSLRLRHAGYSLRVADHVYVYHKKSRSFGAERRRELSRAAGEKLRAKHPEIFIERLEDSMRGNVPLNALRARMVDLLRTERPGAGQKRLAQ